MFISFGTKTVSTLCIQLVRLSDNTVKYGVKEQRSYQLYHCHLTMPHSLLSHLSFKPPTALIELLWFAQKAAYQDMPVTNYRSLIPDRSKLTTEQVHLK